MLKVGAVRHTHQSMGPMLSLKTRADVFSWVCPVLPSDSRLMEVTERYSTLIIFNFKSSQLIISYNQFISTFLDFSFCNFLRQKSDVFFSKRVYLSHFVDCLDSIQTL